MTLEPLNLTRLPLSAIAASPAPARGDAGDEFVRAAAARALSLPSGSSPLALSLSDASENFDRRDATEAETMICRARGSRKLVTGFAAGALGGLAVCGLVAWMRRRKAA